MREYRFEWTPVGPGNQINVQLVLAHRKAMPGTGIIGFPETQLVYDYATEMAFQPRYFDFGKLLDGDDCRNLIVRACFIGQRAAWYEHTAQNVTVGILAKRPDIHFPVLAHGFQMTLQVYNPTRDPVTLAAKIVGEDLPNYNPERSTDDIMTREEAR